MLYITNKAERVLEAISSVKLYAQNTEVLSDDALIDEVMSVTSGTEDDAAIDIIQQYFLNGKLTKKNRKHLCMFYILYHSTPVSEDLC